MAWTLTDLDRLKAAIASGTKRVEFGDGQTRSVKEYQSIDAMLRAKAEIEAELFGTGNLSSRRTVAGYNSGL
jgi:hypothetical protein